MINFKGDLMGFITADWSAYVRVSRNGQRRHSTPSGSYIGHIGHLTTAPIYSKLVMYSTSGWYVCRFLAACSSEIFGIEHKHFAVKFKNYLRECNNLKQNQKNLIVHHKATAICLCRGSQVKTHNTHQSEKKQHTQLLICFTFTPTIIILLVFSKTDSSSKLFEQNHDIH